MPFEPQLTRTVPSFDFKALRKKGEDAATDLVARLTLAELCSSDTAIITRLGAALHMQAPELLLDQSVEVVHAGKDEVRLEIEVPLKDPSGIAHLICKPEEFSSIKFEYEQESSIVRLSEYVGSEDTDKGYADLADMLADYKDNIEETAEQVQRFNAAIPYVVAAFIQRRLDELRSYVDEDPPTKEEIQQALSELTNEGKFVAIEEINPDTGEPQMRYYSAAFAPQPS